jgi:putative NADPH-quinone reductase
MFQEAVQQGPPMSRNICIIDGHPDGDPYRLIHSLANAYADGAAAAGHTVTRIKVSALDFPLLDNIADFETPPPEPVLSERNKIAAADHVVILFPLWLGGMPAKLRAFFEQAARASFFIGPAKEGAHWPAKMMEGKSAHTVITMGMPGLVYRFGMDAGSLKALERSVLGLSGFKPLKHTILGGMGNVSPERYAELCEEMRGYGASAA